MPLDIFKVSGSGTLIISTLLYLRIPSVLGINPVLLAKREHQVQKRNLNKCDGDGGIFSLEWTKEEKGR